MNEINCEEDYNLKIFYFSKMLESKNCTDATINGVYYFYHKEKNKNADPIFYSVKPNHSITLDISGNYDSLNILHLKFPYKPRENYFGKQLYPSVTMNGN